MITVEVFGPGCQRCDDTLATVRRAVRMFGVDANVTHIDDLKEMAKNGVLLTPAVRVDGEVKCTGRVPKVAEVTSWLATAAAKADA